jgi:curved DNA-binding protein CbpA
MGQVQSQLDPKHIGIYRKLLAIQDPRVKLQMIDTLLGDPSIVNSAKYAGIYANLLQVASAIRHGHPVPLLPGEQQQPAQQTTQQRPLQLQHSQPTVARSAQVHPTQFQVATTQPREYDAYQRVTKPKQKEKALGFFAACLKVLGIEEEVALTEETLKAAYKKAARKAHPDKGGSKEAFDAVTRAYAYLVDIIRLVKGASGSAGQGAVPGLDSVHDKRKEAAEAWQMPAQPVRLDPKNLDMNKFNQLFEQTRVPDPDEDGYGDWLKGNDGESSRKKIRGKKFSEDFNREVFNRMFEEEQEANGRGSTTLTNYQHPQELVLSQSAGVELGRDRPSDYTAAYDSGLQFTDLRSAYTKENTVSEKVANVKVEQRDFNTYKEQREKPPERYSQQEMSALEAFRAQQDQREQQRRLRAAQEQVAAQDYFSRMKQLVITNK